MLTKDKGSNGTLAGPCTMGAHLVLCGQLSSDEQPEETLRQRLLATRRLRQQLLTLRDAVATETNALVKRG